MEKLESNPIQISDSRKANLEQNLLLFYTGTSRLGAQVATDIVKIIGDKAKILYIMRSMVDEAVNILNDGDMDDFGRLLHETWLLKRELSPLVSNDTIDEIYETARAHGALGGKLMGAGSAGFMFFYVPEERKEAVRKALSHFLEVSFSFEDKGSHIIL